MMAPSFWNLRLSQEEPVAVIWKFSGWGPHGGVFGLPLAGVGVVPPEGWARGYGWTGEISRSWVNGHF